MTRLVARQPREDSIDDQARKAAAAGEVATGPAYVPALDGVRALAICAVFGLHLDRAHFPGGAAGVDVFFALSAYLITGNLLRDHTGPRPARLGDFYWRRAFRLLPALVLWAFFVAAPTTLATRNTVHLSWNLGGALFYFNDFLQGLTNWISAPFDQSWSLSVEEQFYLVWPFVFLFGVLRLRGKAQQGFFLALTGVGALLLVRGGSYFLPTGHLLPLALGCWAGWSSSAGLPRRLSPLLRLRWFGMACCAVLVAVCVIPDGHSIVDSLLSIAVALAAVGLILSVAQNPSSIAAGVLGSSIPRWIGARSYGMYLYGLTLMQLIPALTHLSLRYAAPLELGTTVAVVGLSYAFIESPIRVRGRRWLRSRSRREQAAALEIDPVA